MSSKTIAGAELPAQLLLWSVVPAAGRGCCADIGDSRCLLLERSDMTGLRALKWLVAYETFEQRVLQLPPELQHAMLPGAGVRRYQRYEGR